MRGIALASTSFLALLAGCARELVCPAGEVACGGRCAAIQIDQQNCGACGLACPAGDVCRGGACLSCASVCGAGRCVGGACLADLYVACFASNEVRGLMADFQAAGAPVPTDNGPVSLAWDAGALWAAHSLVPTLIGIPPDGAAPVRITLGGSDIEVVRSFGALVVASDSGAGTVVVVEPARAATVDEVSLAAAPGDYPNPLAPAFAGTTGYVPLYGSAAAASFAQAQSVAVVDLSTSGTCTAPPCGAVLKRISLDQPSSLFSPGSYDLPGYPFPARAVAVEAPPGRFRVFVTLANLKLGTSGYYTEPAGHGRLAVVDVAAGDALSAVDLGAGCTNPGGIAALGTTVWVACGGTAALVPVDVSGASPVVGTALPMPAGLVPGNLAFCGGQGFVTDQYSGTIARFDPAGANPVATAAICPVNPVVGFAWAADVACGP